MKELSKKYRLYLIFSLLFYGSILHAQTAGPNNAGIGTNLVGIGTITWSNPANIITTNGVNSASILASNEVSNYLQATNYGFSIPNGVVITGIQVTINRRSGSISGGKAITDNVVSLVKNGTITGTNNAAPATLWPLAIEPATYGSSTDLWGTTWTAADINATNFGVVLSAKAPITATRSALVDSMLITVYYIPAPSITSFTPTNTCIGTTPSVVITGNHFNGATSVNFNGVLASFIVNSSTQITATFPTLGTSGTITVTTPSGTGTSVGNFTTIALPEVSSPNSVCIGATIQLSPISGGTWMSNDTTIATITNSGVVTGVASGSTTFTFTNTSSGCSNTTNAIIINSLPTVDAISGITPICIGVTTTLSNTTLGGIWSSGSLGVATIDSNGVVYGIASGTSLISYTVTNGNGCSQTVTATITVIGSPIVSAGSSVCVGDTIQLSPATGGTWTSNDTTIATVDNDGLVTGVASGSTTFTYTNLTTGCSATTTAVNITVSPIIISQPTISQTVCSGSSVSFFVDASGGSLTYQWYKGASVLNNGGAISGANSATLTINPVTVSDVATDYYCIINNGCAIVATSDNAALLLFTAPSILSQTTTVCSGTLFSVTPTDGIPTVATVVPINTTYSWSAPIVTGGISGGTSESGQTSISGNLINPTSSNQTATYTITPNYGTTGSCIGATFSVTITVQPSATILNITTAVCTGETFTITPTDGSGNLVPSGTTYSWEIPTFTGGITGGTSANGQININQTLSNPTNVPQTATYTITASSGTCNGNTFILVVTVNPKPILTVNTTFQTICSGISNSPIIVSNPSNVITTYSWTRDNTVNATGITSGTSGTIAAGATYSISNILTNTTTTAQTVVYTITPTTNGCFGDPITSTVILETPSLAGSVTVSQPTILPVVNNVTVCHFASGTLYLNGHTGNIVRWEYSANGGNVWTPIANTTSTYTYTNITVTTVVRAVVQNGTSCSFAYATSAILNVIPNIKPSPVTATPSTICVGGSSELFSQSGFATTQYIGPGGTFSNSNPDNWSVDGCGNCLNAGSSNTNPNPFQLSATNGGTYSGITYTSSGKFAIANGNFNSIMQTPVFNTFGLSTASLSFNHAFNLLAGAWAKVELSLDGGATYTIVLAEYVGAATRSPYTAFPNSNIDISTYVGQSNLKVRFNYHGTVGSSWAIDNILIPQEPENLTTQWVDSATGIVISNTATVMVTPIVTTTYAVTSYLNGCSSYGPDGTTYVTVYVNQRPTAEIGPSQTICNGGTATFSVTLTGTAPWNLTYSNGTTQTTVITSTNPYVFSVNNITSNQIYTIIALSDTKCTSTATDLTGSANVIVLNGTQGLWTGLVSKDWFDCMNWAGGLPTSTVNAVIPNGSTQMPIIDPTSSFAALYGGIARAQDLIIGTTASVTMAANSNLHISRDWKNNGVFNSGTGTVTFNSAISNQVQTINVGIKTNETFYNLTVNNSNSSKGISVVDGFELTVSNNLSLESGDLRLTGEAQLVQNGLTANPSTGTGRLLRDQQGTKSSFNYNYWSSPVSNNNTTYTIASVLRDGTDVTTSPFNPGTITFGNGSYFADGTATNPIKISNRWLYKFTAVSNSYNAWQAVGNSGSLKVAEGFTMKGTDGTAAVTTLQNYVFAGKPNNGTILLNILPNQSYLVGNPYASALNADEFIKDNIKDGGYASNNIINGALYFWDHFGGQTHFTSGYVGGYATYTLMGGVVSIANSPLNINNGSTGTKVPKKYIPVGQGFFIGTNLAASAASNNPNLSSPITGGTVTFKNSQRVFKTESATNSVFLRSNVTVVNPSESEDNRPKIRLKYDTPGGLHRQLLVGADDHTTSQFDLGYDAPMIDVNADDMYWEINNARFVIQALPDFNFDRVIPFGLKITNLGESIIKVIELENISEETQIYLYDNQTGIYHNFINGGFSIMLPVGDHNNRFAICFTDDTSVVTGKEIKDLKEMTVKFTNNNNVLNINNHLDEVITNVTLFNLLGQDVANWNIENQNQKDIQILIQNLVQGTYIVKIKTNKTDRSKKIIIK